MPERKIRGDWAGLETSAYNKLRRKPVDLWSLNLSRYSLGLETRGQGPQPVPATAFWGTTNSWLALLLNTLSLVETPL